MDPDSKRLRVTVTDARGRPVRAAGLGAWLAGVAPARARGDVAIALVSDARIRALNRAYRRIDRPTDVLSFRNSEPCVPHSASRIPRPAPRAPHSAPRSSPLEPRFLGDIVIATGVARRQARQAGHPYGAELRVLALHGLLHLLGYDHHAADDRGRMARLETRLRKQGGLGRSLIERAQEAALRPRALKR